MDKVARTESKLALASLKITEKSLQNCEVHLLRATKKMEVLEPIELKLLIESRAIIRSALTLIHNESMFIEDLLEDNDGTP